MLRAQSWRRGCDASSLELTSASSHRLGLDLALSSLGSNSSASAQATVRSAASAMTGGSHIRGPGGDDGGGAEANTRHPDAVNLLLGAGPLSGSTTSSANRGRGLIRHRPESDSANLVKMLYLQRNTTIKG